MQNVNKFKNGVNLIPTSTSTSAKGDIASDSSTGEIRMHDGTTERKVITDTATQTLTNKTLSGNTATTLVSGSGTLTLNTTGTVTVPNTTDTLVGKATTDTLTNKTISGNTASNLVNGSGTVNINSTGTVTLPNATDTLVGKATADTLTNKTLTTPVITNPTLSGSGGTLTLPAGPDTLIGRATTDTLTNKTLTSPVISTPTGIVKGDVGLGNVDNTSDATKNSAVATLSNKTFSDAVTAAQIATPTSPSSGFDKLYFKSDDKLYTLNSAGVETTIGAGSGGINYISNPDAESATTGWATYSNTAANIPSTGTGGTATGLTFARSTSSPLRGAASFLITQANSTSLQGKGVSYDFTINSADQARMLSISFDYNASSTFVASNGITPPLNDGTTTTNAGNSDIEVFIYDKTNSVLIPVSPQVLSANGTNNYSYVGQFQTASNSTSYRLIFHCATTSANATGYSLKFDNVICGPQTKLLGPPITDWVTTTTTITATTTNPSKGTTSNDIFAYRRVGDSLEFYVDYTQTGAGSAGSGTYLFPLPNNLTIDTTKVNPSSGGTTMVIGSGGSTAGTGTNVIQYPGYVGVYDSTHLVFSYINNLGGTTNFVGSAAQSLSNTNVTYTFTGKVPIAGWSSTTTMSNDTDTRVVGALYKGVPTGTLNSGYNLTTFPTFVSDTHSAYSGGTYTVPVSGLYDIAARIRISGTFSLNQNHNIAIFINGAAAYENVTFSTTSVSAINLPISVEAIPLKAGDTVQIQSETQSSSPAYSGGASESAFSIARRSGPATIAASESVNASYTLSSNYSAGVGAVIIYNSKNFDSHNAYNTSTGLYAAPASGKYLISATYDGSGTSNIFVGVQGSNVGYLPQALGTNSQVCGGSIIVSVLAGQTIGLYSGSAITYNSGLVSSLCISRIGN